MLNSNTKKIHNTNSEPDMYEASFQGQKWNWSLA